MDRSRKTVFVFSGGIDLTTLLYHLIDLGHEVRAISFDYGRRNRKELDAATKIANLLLIDRRIVNVSGLAEIFGSNALTDQEVDVPHGEYAPENMQVTFVLNRNLIMLSIAVGWAISLDYNSVAFGAHSGEYTPYPDCQPQFAAAMNAATHACDTSPIEVLSPFVHWPKAAIIKRGQEPDVPFHITWSCYDGNEHHCGRCWACTDRVAAFAVSDALGAAMLAKSRS